MLTPAEVMKVLQTKNQMLTLKNDEYVTLSGKRAEAERQWKTAYATEMLKLKLDGKPVTIIKDLCAGATVVSSLKFDYEVALAIEKACLESMKDIREAIGSARSILTWQRTELESR